MVYRCISPYAKLYTHKKNQLEYQVIAVKEKKKIKEKFGHLNLNKIPIIVLLYTKQNLKTFYFLKNKICTPKGVFVLCKVCLYFSKARKLNSSNCYAKLIYQRS